MKTTVYNIKESPYKFTWRRITFVFSSEFRLNKFKNKLDGMIDEVNNALTIRYRIPICIPEIAAMRLYRETEPVQFLVYVDGKAVTNWEDLQINNAKLYARY